MYTRHSGADAIPFRPLVAVLASIVPLTASAQSSPYCEKVREHAAADAALLMSPRVIVQAIRFPSNGQVQATSGVVVGAGYQARAGLSFSPLDFYRATRVLRVGDADCDQHEALESIRGILLHGAEQARAAALRAQAAYLQDHRDQLHALAERAEQRLAARLITVVEFQELRQKCDEVERKLVDAEGEAKQLQERSRQAPRALGALTERYEQIAMRFERETSHLRSLDAWHFQLTGGIIPLDPIDWYGLAELSYSPGGVFHGEHESRYLAARDEELQRAEYEPAEQAREFRRQLRAALEQARGDLAIVDRDVAAIADTRLILDRSSAADVAHAQDTLSVETLLAESDRAFLRKWVEALSASLEDGHGF
jgi:hypothetical protein